MASDPGSGWRLTGGHEDGDEPVVFRSGSWYVVKRGTLGRAIRPDGLAGDLDHFQSLMAHIQVVAPWVRLDADADLPEAVAEVVADAEDWDEPNWSLDHPLAP